MIRNNYEAMARIILHVKMPFQAEEGQKQEKAEEQIDQILDYMSSKNVKIMDPTGNITLEVCGSDFEIVTICKGKQ